MDFRKVIQTSNLVDHYMAKRAKEGLKRRKQPTQAVGATASTELHISGTDKAKPRKRTDQKRRKKLLKTVDGDN